MTFPVADVCCWIVGSAFTLIQVESLMESYIETAEQNRIGSEFDE